MYDYVIVGAGSAGCVLANRLSEDPDVNVLLLEAGGPDTNDLVHLPAAFSALYRTAQDWDHSTIYEPFVNDRRIYLPRGKVLGGSSSINAMIYIRGNPIDYDEWGPGWTWDEMLPYFKLSEDNERGEDEYHGAGGPLPVSEGRSRNPLGQAFLDSAAAHGLPANEDFNGAEQDGVGWYQVTHRNGARASAAVAYLHPVMDRPNLTVETHVHALSLLFEGERAVGVVGMRLSEMLVHRAEREVIVCGGAYNSPQLLMLSGLGRPAELEELQIEVVAELPEVGLNLHDHPNAGAVYSIDEEISLFGALNEENLALFEAEGRGPLTSNVAEAGGFMRTSDGLEAPDIQVHFAPARFQSEGLVPGDGHGFALGACVLKPKSRGFVALGSPDPTAKPLIMHNYMEHPDDVASMVAGVRTCLEICETGRARRALDRDADRPGVALGRGHPRPRAGARADALPPRRHLPDGRRPRRRGGPPAARERHRGPARGGRLGDADRAARQHERPGDRAGGASGRPDPRPDAAGLAAGARGRSSRSSAAVTDRLPISSYG